MAVQRNIDTLRRLGQGQLVRLRFEDGTALEARVNQTAIDPDERIRVELTTDDDGDGSRYQVRSALDGGAWAPVEVRRYVRPENVWRTLTAVDEIVPMEMYRTMKSDDMEAQEDTGTAR